MNIINNEYENHILRGFYLIIIFTIFHLNGSSHSIPIIYTLFGIYAFIWWVTEFINIVRK